MYAAPDLRAGAAGSVFDLVRSPALNHRVAVTAGVQAGDARAQLDRFFAGLRRRERARLAPSALSETTTAQTIDQADETGPESGAIR